MANQNNQHEPRAWHHDSLEEAQDAAFMKRVDDRLGAALHVPAGADWREPRQRTNELLCQHCGKVVGLLRVGLGNGTGFAQNMEGLP